MTIERPPTSINAAEVGGGLAPTPGYRYAEQTGDRLHVAGQVPLDRSGELVGIDDVDKQTRTCLENLRTLVLVHGFTTNDIRHVTIYVVGDRGDISAAWSTVRSWFQNDVPPATLLGVNLLGYDEQLVEIDAVVMRNEPPDSDSNTSGSTPSP